MKKKYRFMYRYLYHSIFLMDAVFVTNSNPYNIVNLREAKVIQF